MKDHRIYNERLVNRREILISKKVIGNWDNELAVMMNRGKEGRPYAYPESFMRIIAYTMVRGHVYLAVRHGNVLD